MRTHPNSSVCRPRLAGSPRLRLSAALPALALGWLIVCSPSTARVAAADRHVAPGPVQIAEAVGQVAQAVRLYRARQYHRARAIARVILLRQRTNPAALSILGWSEYQLGRYAAARVAFERFVRVAPRSSDALIGLAWSNFKTGRLAGARRRFEQAKPVAVGDQRYVVADGLGWVAYVERRLDAADRHFASEAVQRARGRTQNDGALGRAWVAMTRGRYKAARAYLETDVKRQPRYFRLHDGLGRLALLQGRYDEAVRHALEGLRLVRFNRELFLLLDGALRARGDHARAAAVYRGLIKTYPDIPEYYNGRGWAELRRNQPRRAEASFLIALQMNRRYGWARQGLERARGRMHAPVVKAWATYRQGDYEAALAAFERHLGVAGSNPAIHTGRGWSLLGLGRVPEAKAAFAKALAVDQNFGLARRGFVAAGTGYRTTYLLGWDQIEAKRFAKARIQFGRAAKIAPPNERWRIAEGLAWVDLFEGKPDRAETVFKRILGTQSRAHLSRKGLGYIALARKQYGEAAVQLRASFKLQPRQIVTSFTVPADRLNDAGRFKLAREILQRGARYYGRNSGVLFQLARAHAGMGDPRRAAILARRAIATAPRHIDPVFDKLKLPAPAATRLRLRLAWALYFARDNVGALRRFEEYLKAGGEDPNAIRGRGFALFRLGQYDRAIRNLTIAAKSEPARLRPVRQVVPIPGSGQSWPIVYNARSALAWAYFRTRRFDAAAREFRAVLAKHPSWIDALTGLGYCLQRLGDRPGAMATYRAALLISPGYPDAWQGLQQLGADR
jgi:tetratricopeptide (TPR) repeat protein